MILIRADPMCIVHENHLLFLHLDSIVSECPYLYTAYAHDSLCTCDPFQCLAAQIHLHIIKL